MKYLKKFFNVNYYNQFINRTNFEGPNVSLLSSNHEVKYITRPMEYDELTIPGYTVLEYISSTQTGGQYIDLGCKLLENTDDIQIDIKFNHHGQGKVMNNVNGDKQWTLIGNQVEASPYSGFVLRHATQGGAGHYCEFMAKWEFSNSNYDSNYYAYLMPGTHIGLYSKTHCDDIYAISILLDNIPNEQINQLNTHLFCAVNGNGDPWRFAYADLYYLKIIKGNQIIRNLIPVKKNSNNAVGLYDLENNVFYQSQSNEPFVPHYKVSTYNTIYKKIEYIKNSGRGAQYFDLNCKLFENTDDIQIDIKFNILGSGYGDNYGTGFATLLGSEYAVSPYPGFILRRMNASNIGSGDNHDGVVLSVRWPNSQDTLDTETSNLYFSKYMNGHFQEDLYGATTTNQIYEKTFILDNIPDNQIHNINTTVFCSYNNSSSPSQFCYGQLYYLKLIKGNQIIRDLIPVERLTDHKLGLYDKEHNVFYEPLYGRNDIQLYEPLIQGEYIN